MADVAADAGVAVQTVYFTFHTKAELLRACFERAVLGEEDPLPPQLQPFWRAMLEAGSGEEAIGHFVRGNAAIVQRVARLANVVAATTHEPDAVAIWTRSEELRRAGYREAVQHVESRFGLRKGLSAEKATDILLTLGSAAPYVALVVEYGWTHEAYLDWATGALSHMLLSR